MHCRDIANYFELFRVTYLHNCSNSLFDSFALSCLSGERISTESAQERWKILYIACFSLHEFTLQGFLGTQETKAADVFQRRNLHFCLVTLVSLICFSPLNSSKGSIMFAQQQDYFVFNYHRKLVPLTDSSSTGHWLIFIHVRDPKIKYLVISFTLFCCRR